MQNTLSSLHFDGDEVTTSVVTRPLLNGLLGTIGDTLDKVGDAVEQLTGSTGSTVDNVVDTVADLLRSSGDSDGGPLGSLLNTGLDTGAILGITTNSNGLLQLDVLGTQVIVLPNNGGIVTVNADGTPGSDGNLLDLGGLLGNNGLLNLTGLIGPNGILDLSGLLGAVTGLLGGGGVQPGDYTDGNGNVDPAKFAKSFIGTEARDHFSVTESVSTYVDGRGGIDTIDMARSAKGLSLSVGSEAVMLSDDKSLYYFTSVERVKFTEGTLYLDTGQGENSGVAYRLYQATFDRTPDKGGVKYWIDRIDSGLSGHDAAGHFVASAEFKQTYGSLSNTQFVATIYENVLGRTGEAGGTAFWENYLSTGQGDRASVLLGFSESSENVQLVGQSISDGFLA